jgi:DNA polymerase-3 subunit delta'
MAPVPTEECAAALRTAQPELNEQNAQDLAFLYEGHIGLCLKALTDPAAKVARAAARELCRQAQQQDAYRVQALLAGYEKDKDSAAAVLWQATQAASAALRRPGFDGVQPDTAARILRAAEAARRAMKANGNLRLALTVCGMEMAAR